MDETGTEIKFAAPKYYCRTGRAKPIIQTCSNVGINFTCPIEFACAKMFKRDYLDYNDSVSNMSSAARSRLMADNSNTSSYSVCAGGITKEECEIYCKTTCLKMDNGGTVTTYRLENEGMVTTTDTMNFYCPDKSEIRDSSYTETYCPSYSRDMSSSITEPLHVFCQNQVDCVEVRSDTFKNCNTTT